MSKVTSPSDYRKKVYTVEEVEAPSGAIFKIKKLSVLDFVKDGNSDVPNGFLEFMKSDTTAKDLAKATKDEDTNKFLNNILTTMILKGIVEPKVALKYNAEEKEDVLYWSEIREEDQIFLFNIISGGAIKKV
jgi:hypothetical protein